jgi:hypothetical protein
MPLTKNSITAAEFESLMDYITLQKQAYDDAEGYAASGLQYVALMQRVTPEVDLIAPHASHFLGMEAQNTSTNFTQIVNSINDHVVTRGTTANPAETLSSRLNRWLWCQGVRVTRFYHDISADAGWSIDWCNVRSDDNNPNSQMGEYVYDSEGNIIAVGCTDQSLYKDPPTDPDCPTTGGDEIGTTSP